MAGLYNTLRPTSSSSPSSSSTFISRLLLLLTVLPLSLAAFAFILQWKGGLNDPTTRWSSDRHEFPGMVLSEPVHSSSSDCVDLLGKGSLPSLPYYKNWNNDLRPKEVLILVLGFGVSWVIIGKAASPTVSNALESIPGVKVIYRTRELEEQQAKRLVLFVFFFNTLVEVLTSPYRTFDFLKGRLAAEMPNDNYMVCRIWNETWLASFFYKPCNYELFVKQSLNMEMAIVIAQEAGMDWIIHLDTDELLHPVGACEYSVRKLLSDVPGDVDMESSVEQDDIKEPFSEVSMFKKNYDHLPKETYFGNYKEATRGNPNYFLTYGNGKAAARIQDHLRPNGAHRWHNYMKTPNTIQLDEAAVLHYTYPKFSDFTSRRDRCDCKPTKEDVKRCFMLDFDRAAFIIASTATQDEMLHWYREHIVWTDKALNIKLLKKGILTRIDAPMVIVQGLKDTGIFSNVIASAQTSLSKGKLLSSIESSNPSKVAAEFGGISSRKIGGNMEESQATASKVLEIEGSDFHAMPPQSPPAITDIHLDMY
ncbi:unnamed protein product [Ilex paraguariensis]|uniref:Glycosyltransferase family 92 protein n=1 Tax=Ilex paraguariensis TaxID=185542 RepID=A0ABC8UTC4_9AQUA